MIDWQALKSEAASIVAQTMGERVSYHYAEGRTVNLCAVFGMADAQVDMGEVSIDSVKPMASIRICELERKPKQGDLITRRDVTYEVTTVRETLDTTYQVLLHMVDSRGARRQRQRT